jgi:N-acetylglucosaminyldiphosphoundecaprenol N-acetyl-beta-D-mannosaminyltransferase
MSETAKSRVAILGIAIDNLTMDQVLEAVQSQIAEGGFHQIATANADFLTQCVRDEELREVLGGCDIVLPDGMPLVWASRFLGVRLGERVTGSDLVPRLARLSAQHKYRIFLLGASEESSAGTVAWMEKHHPGVCIAGRLSPSLQPLERMDHDQILSCIESARPDILLVAFGTPKQEKWLAMHRHRLRVPVCIGVGASFDFLSGRVRRAPSWMQRCGMEWFYRITQEPSRLTSRYLSNAVALLRYLPGQLLAMSRQKSQCSPVQVSKETVGSAKILRIKGAFTGAFLSRFEEDVRREFLVGSHVVLDLSDTAYIGADAIGSLIHLLDLSRRRRRELWLTGLQPSLLRVLRGARMGLSIRVAPHIAEALRRIEPERSEVSLMGEDCAFFRIGGQLVPIQAREMPEIYRQVRALLQQRISREPIALLSPDGREQAGSHSGSAPQRFPDELAV